MIDDRGTGMDQKHVMNAMRLGISEKNPKDNIGFRGIGIYTAYNLCDRLDIYTKSESDVNGYLIHFDFKKARLALLEDQERKKQNLPTTVFLEKLLRETIFYSVDNETTLNAPETRVIMSELLSDVYDDLNNWDKVENYLRDIVPLPFREDFKYAKLIQDKLIENQEKIVPVTLQIWR